MPRGAREFDPASLRAIRRERGLTQEQLGRAVGVRRTYAMQWERSQHRGDAISPTPAVLARIAEVLDVHPSELTRIDRDEATLADLRVWAGLSRAELADRLAVPTTNLWRIEHGQRRLDEDLVEGLAAELGVPPTDILAAHQRVSTLG